MKFSVTATETERLLASVERTATGDGVDYQVSLFDEKGGESKQNVKGAQARVVGMMLEVQLSDGSRQSFPILSRPGDGVMTVATALGSMRVTVSRGAGAGLGTGAAGGTRAIKSSMPGKVLKILCNVGDTVAAGQPLLIIEAMKMENEIKSPVAGIVEAVSVEPGKKVETGELLVKLGKA
jgi:biotin carboxyl carrier protein